MLSKSPGDVGCAHCKRAGARHDCPSCRRIVCASCLADPWSCAVRVARRLRLGMGTRLRAVDRGGRWAVVSDWRARQVPYDLAHRCPLEGSIPGGRGGPPGRLPSFVDADVAVERDGTLVWPDAATPGTPGTEGLVRARAGEAAAVRVAGVSGEARRGTLQLCRTGELAWFLSTSERVILFDFARGRAHALSPSIDRVLQAAYFDPVTSLLIVGSYGRVFCAHVDRGTGSLTRTGVIRADDRDIVWVATAAGVIAFCSRDSRGAVLSFYRVDDDLAPFGRPFYTWSSPGHGIRIAQPVIADLDDRGTMVAIATDDDGVSIIFPDGSPSGHLTAHSDRISLVSFTDAGHTLITGDYDNRVVIWPGGDEGFVTRILDVPAG